MMRLLLAALMLLVVAPFTNAEEIPVEQLKRMQQDPYGNYFIDKDNNYLFCLIDKNNPEVAQCMVFLYPRTSA